MSPRTTTAKKSTSARSKAKTSTAKGKVDKASSEILDKMKTLVRAQLGLFGEISDELNTRMDKLRTEAPAQWKSLVKRGQQLQKEIDKAQGDLRKNLEKTQSDLKKNLDKAQKTLRSKVEKLRPS